jgi:hypothetical protein
MISQNDATRAEIQNLLDSSDEDELENRLGSRKDCYSILEEVQD